MFFVAAYMTQGKDYELSKLKFSLWKNNHIFENAIFTGKYSDIFSVYNNEKWEPEEQQFTAKIVNIH